MLYVAQVAVYKTHKYSVGRTYHCWLLNLLVHRVTRRLNAGARAGAVVEALRYKPESRGIDSRRCHWNFSLT
jgi:hypothetical protein